MLEVITKERHSAFWTMHFLKVNEKPTEGWELYIVTGGVTITPPVTIYSSHPSLLPMTLGTCLSRIIFYSLVMAF
jgi:hypothetical protein